MKVTNSSKKIEQLVKLNDTANISFDMKIQRSEDIWDKKRRSKMIHTILLDWPTSTIFAAKDGKSLSIIDGKQRLTTTLAYLNNKFALDASTPPVGEHEVKGLKFKDLPDELKHIFMEYKFEFTQVEEATMEELEEFFFRVNSGMPLKQIETTRAILGGKTLKLVEDVANMPFFQTKANLSKTSKKRFVDQELVLQILASLHKAETGYSGKEIEAFVRELRNQRTQDEVKSKLSNAGYYLNQVFVKKEKYLRKLHIPTLFKLVLDVQGKNVLIPPTEFEEWANVFFNNMPADYNAACQSGSAKKESIMIRYNSMKAHFDNYFQNRTTTESKEEAQDNVEESAS